ncbi:MAG: hypothetical protein WC761_01805 [Candidatus Paceibacterota bacterium]|jgi:hypothetical protein
MTCTTYSYNDTNVSYNQPALTYNGGYAEGSYNDSCVGYNERCYAYNGGYDQVCLALSTTRPRRVGGSGAGRQTPNVATQPSAQPRRPYKEKTVEKELLYVNFILRAQPYKINKKLLDPETYKETVISVKGLVDSPNVEAQGFEKHQIKLNIGVSGITQENRPVERSSVQMSAAVILKDKKKTDEEK